MAGRKVIQLSRTGAELVPLTSESALVTGGYGSDGGLVVLDGHRRPVLPDGLVVLGPPGGPYAVVDADVLRHAAATASGAVDVERLPGARRYRTVSEANDDARSTSPKSS